MAEKTPSTGVRTTAERRAVVERVLSSQEFGASARIRAFLAFVCDRALNDSSVQLHEQEIGRRVFGRGADYDTTSDNVVRVTACQARKKLERFFSLEGLREPCILEIPRGQYTPVFRERSLSIDTAKSGQRQLLGRLVTPPRAPLFLAVSSFLAFILALWAWWAPRTEQKAAPELEMKGSLNALWSLLLPREGRTDVVVMDSGLSLFQETQQRQLTLSEYLQPDVWTRSDSLSSNPELRTFVERTAQRRLSSLGAVTAAFRIAQLAGSRQTQVFVISARDFNVRLMKSDNVVLLGSDIANPWVSLVEDRLNFRFGYDRVSRFAYFDNRKPKPGEQARYLTDSDVSYCEIAFLPNLARTGNILAICGAEVEGTECGGEFITSERSLKQLRSFANMDLGDRLPYFEVLLKSNKVGGATPGCTPVAFRILGP